MRGGVGEHAEVIARMGVEATEELYFVRSRGGRLLGPRWPI
jgi:hypothetical protein